jgi:hypothetical protein
MAFAEILLGYVWSGFRAVVFGMATIRKSHVFPPGDRSGSG